MPKKRRRTRLWLGLGAGCGALVLMVLAGCAGLVYWFFSPTNFPPQTQDYVEARKAFKTNLIVHGAAPQMPVQTHLVPGASEVDYQSGDLRLKAWVSSSPGEGKPKQPAVIFLHGGFGFDESDWEQTLPFRNAGFVVMVPWLRGENRLPGSYSMFYHEVDDVLGATEVLAKLPYVDPDRLFVAGHSVGGTLALLTSMTSNRFRAAASFSGSPDQVLWSRGQPELVPFNLSDAREYQMRSPLAFPASFKCPVRVYYGGQEILFIASSQKLAKLARSHNLDVEAISVPGDHLSSTPGAIQQAIVFFKGM